MNNTIDALNWRYATKQFDATKKVSQDDIDTLLESARLTASSYGLQPYHFFLIENKEVREKLKPVSWNQSQITDASHLLVLANKPTFDERLIDDYIDNIIATRGVSKDNLQGYIDMMKTGLLNLPDNIKNSWTAKQAYIALGTVLTTAALLKIDTCPIEGFDPTEYNKILQLTEKGLNASVVLAIGYRSTEDQTQHYPKVRYAKEKLITII